MHLLAPTLSFDYTNGQEVEHEHDADEEYDMSYIQYATHKVLIPSHQRHIGKEIFDEIDRDGLCYNIKQEDKQHRRKGANCRNNLILG